MMAGGCQSAEVFVGSLEAERTNWAPPGPEGAARCRPVFLSGIVTKTASLRGRPVRPPIR